MLEEELLAELMTLLTDKGDVFVALEHCTVLAGLLLKEEFSRGTSSGSTGRRLYASLRGFADEEFALYLAHWRAEKAIDVNRGRALAACALIRVITESWTGPQTRRPSDMDEIIDSRMIARRDTAGTWIDKSGRRMQDRETHLLQVLRNRLIDFAANSVETPPHGKATNPLVAPLTLASERMRTTRDLGESYLRRGGLHDAIEEAEHDSQRLIVLAGDQGTGRATLALNYVREHANGRPYMLADFRDSKRLVASIYDSLLKFDHATVGLSVENSWLKLRELVSRCEDATYCILTNVSISDDLEFIAYAPPNVTVLVTTADSRVLREAARCIDVGDLSEREAEAAIKLKLPDVTTFELQALKVLNGRLLAIDLVCAFMRRANPVRRRSFVDALSLYTAKQVERAASSLGRAKPEAVYQVLLDQFELEGQPRSTIRLLELEAANVVTPFAETMEEFFVGELLSAGLEEVDAREEYRFARDLLTDLHLLRPTHRYSLDRSRHLHVKEATELHPLTAETLQGLFGARWVNRCKQLMQVCVDAANHTLQRFDVFIQSRPHERYAHKASYLLIELTIQAEPLIRAGEIGKKASNDPYFDELITLGMHMKMSVQAYVQSHDLPTLGELFSE